MACPHPLKAYRLKMVQRGDKVILWQRPRLDSAFYEEVDIPCGQCIECRLAYARHWAVRLQHEEQMHDVSSFLTLTYSDDELPFCKSGLPTLRYDDMQSFIKRLRRRLGDKKIRFYYSGEYGSRTQRPHYHMIAFGFWPKDAKYLKRSSDFPIYTSQLVDDCWRKGHVWIGHTSFDTMAYVAGYVIDKRKGNKDELERWYCGREPEKSVMSRRPGIGAEWLNRYRGDVFPRDEVITDKGFKLRPCRYYLDKYFFDGDLEYDQRRDFKALRKASFDARPVSIDRLLAREERHKKERRERRVKL